MNGQKASKMTLGAYLKETNAELKKILWPSRREIIRDTLIVVVGSVAVGILLAAFDVLFSKGLELLLQLKR